MCKPPKGSYPGNVVPHMLVEPWKDGGLWEIIGSWKPPSSEGFLQVLWPWGTCVVEEPSVFSESLLFTIFAMPYSLPWCCWSSGDAGVVLLTIQRCAPNWPLYLSSCVVAWDLECSSGAHVLKPDCLLVAETDRKLRSGGLDGRNGLMRWCLWMLYFVSYPTSFILLFLGHRELSTFPPTICSPSWWCASAEVKEQHIQWPCTHLWNYELESFSSIKLFCLSL